MELKVKLSDEQLDHVILDDLALQLSCVERESEPEMYEAILKVMSLYEPPMQASADQLNLDIEQTSYMYGNLSNLVEPTIDRVSYHFGV